MEQEEAGCKHPKGPILCINNCGFFGSPATMNMCSKCHREIVVKQEQEKLVISSVDSIMNSETSRKEPIVPYVDAAVTMVNAMMMAPTLPSEVVESSNGEAIKSTNGPNRCSTCKKRVGLTGFTCRCGNMFCSTHRYSDKHNCTFDYRNAGRDAIAKANPVVKAEKLDKI